MKTTEAEASSAPRVFALDQTVQGQNWGYRDMYLLAQKLECELLLAAKRSKELEKDFKQAEESRVVNLSLYHRTLKDRRELEQQLSQLRADYKQALEALKELSTTARAAKDCLDVLGSKCQHDDGCVGCRLIGAIMVANAILSTPSEIAMKGEV